MHMVLVPLARLRVKIGAKKCSRSLISVHPATAMFEFSIRKLHSSHSSCSFSAAFGAGEQPIAISKPHSHRLHTREHRSQAEIAMAGPLLWQNFKVFVTRYPIVRGMISYSLIWPTGSLIQQTVEGRRWGTYDWWRVLRFSMYGGLFVAPTLYGWVKISSAMWPQTSLRTGVIKAAVETISYTPGAMTCFYFIMSLLESKTVEQAVAEVGKKFLPTYKVALSVWPLVATINFTLIPERNRVPFISACSLCWTCFLAYMKHLEHHEVDGAI
ncbi:protein sym1 isoform X1 [Drosophila simulans]|uniref:protein sym1 isoform X1 n=1 Tax=Drosophila simulans TaxID=7240 RepID=UPI00192D0972|nr:protein sym1 isoform X1 [Drosophila simulans]